MWKMILKILVEKKSHFIVIFHIKCTRDFKIWFLDLLLLVCSLYKDEKMKITPTYTYTNIICKKLKSNN